VLKNFKDQKVLITGHTGFKGSWLSVWLKMLGARVIGISNSLGTDPSHYKEISKIFDKDIIADIRQKDELTEFIHQNEPNYIFHLAAQPIVLESYKDPYLTFTSNTLGTLNILESLRGLKKNCIVILITSDKSYENRELKRGYKENDRLGGYDPYSGSKAAAELVIKSYFHSFFKENNKIKLSIARAGNVIGGGDWSNGRIVPDAIRAWQSKQPLLVRSPNSTRPWQHVLDPLYGYLLMADLLSSGKPINGEAYNFGPCEDENPSVQDVLNILKEFLPKFSWEKSVEEDVLLHESKLLALNCTKAMQQLNWAPKINFKDTMRYTADWYLNYYSNSRHKILNFSMSQIDNYISN